MEDLFRSALSQEDCLAFRVLDKHGHHAPREVEWDLVEFPVLLNQGLLVEVGTIENCGPEHSGGYVDHRL